jgi:hypothetical protein
MTAATGILDQTGTTAQIAEIGTTLAIAVHSEKMDDAAEADSATRMRWREP